ncbi:C-type lectin domain family 4 member K-like [Neocloeon triangulifer]|uniref:C-type lectin domain family 4 member K-like n=1 Tax=Neocloeon triangulifer TaxID=2078957 RepID=UPI00286FA068|nr:C-type lectin domain family 4 member K-like [Neocloeon triangulifer]
MACFVSLLFFLVAAALATEPAIRAQESDFRQEILRMFNETNQNMNILTKLHQQTLEYVKQVEKQQNQKLDALSRVAERHLQYFLANCNVALSANLKALTNGKKYSFHSTVIEWANARDSCAKQGLHLASIGDQSDAEALWAATQNVSPNTYWWVSAKNAGSWTKKNFRWHDGTKLEMDSPLWKAEAQKTADCVVAANWGNGTLKVEARPCINDYYYICQLPTECFSAK